MWFRFAPALILGSFALCTQVDAQVSSDVGASPQLQESNLAPKLEKAMLEITFADALKFGTMNDAMKKVAESKYINELPSEFKKRIENQILAYTKPLSAQDVEGNKLGYEALAALDPENRGYSDKLRHYSSLYEKKESSLLSLLNKEHDEFNGITWYTHPNTPKYMDARNYLELYLGEKDGETWLRFRLNYTADRWLFIESAKANIDGLKHSLWVGDFKRDNDTEIWEWADAKVDDVLLLTVRMIAYSDKTIVRLDGRQYYDDFVVKEADKLAMREMLLAKKILDEKSKDPDS